MFATKMTGTAAVSAVRALSTSSTQNAKVAVAGAAGGIGQPLSLLLKQSPLVTQLSLYDVAPVTPGVACDLSHMNTHAKVTGYVGADQMEAAFADADVVVVPAGVPRKPGMTRDDLFNTNASIVRDIAKAVAKAAPRARLALITNPVNSAVPIAAEVLRAAGCHDPRRLFGVSTLDVVRANAFVAEARGLDVATVHVPVIGGHSGVTILPLLSQAQPGAAATFDGEERERITRRIQNAGTEVVEKKAGGGSATLSMAFAGARFVLALLRAARGEAGVVECAYVASDCVPGVEYFATPLLLGKEGIEKNLGLPKMNAYEQKLLEEALPELKANIAKGIEFAKKQ